MNFGSLNPTFLSRAGVGLACLFLASVFRRTLPSWARGALLTVGTALMVGSFLR
jgi:hypothetical protein